MCGRHKFLNAIFPLGTNTVGNKPSPHKRFTTISQIPYRKKWNASRNMISHKETRNSHNINYNNILWLNFHPWINSKIIKFFNAETSSVLLLLRLGFRCSDIRISVWSVSNCSWRFTAFLDWFFLHFRRVTKFVKTSGIRFVDPALVQEDEKYNICKYAESGCLIMRVIRSARANEWPKDYREGVINNIKAIFKSL